MPDPAAIISALIADQPLCLRCISEKVRLTVDEIESYLTEVVSMYGP
jgi:hypothetical protein